MVAVVEENVSLKSNQLQAKEALAASLLNALDEVKPLLTGKRSVKNDIDEKMKKWESWADDTGE